LADDRFGELGEQRRVLGLVPFYRELVGRPDDQPAFVERDGLGGLEPGPDRMIGKFAMRLIEDSFPGIFRGQLHRDSTSGGRFFKGERCYGAGVEKSMSEEGAKAQGRRGAGDNMRSS
jgi:hypothetical protein